MNCQIFDHTLTLNMTAEMRDDIDRALILVQDTLVLTRSEFIRVACQYALDSLAADSGDVPVSVEEREGRGVGGGRAGRRQAGQEGGGGGAGADIGLG